MPGLVSRRTSADAAPARRVNTQPAAASSTRTAATEVQGSAGWTPRNVSAPVPNRDGFTSLRASPAPLPAAELVDGTPLYAQSDAQWGRRTLGRSASISASGCAMTATAMAISKVSGRPINPGELDQYLDRRKGYSGDALDWDKAGAARGLKVNREPWTLQTIDTNLAEGRPVVIGVDYKKGSRGGAGGTDHWVCLTRKDQDENGRTYYAANDPGSGKSIRLYPDARGRLSGDGTGALGKYRTTGQLRTFSE